MYKICVRPGYSPSNVFVSIDYSNLQKVIVYRPNIIERIFGVTWEKKIEKAKNKLKQMYDQIEELTYETP